MKKDEEQRNSQESFYDSHFSGYKNYQLENWRLAYLRRIFELLAMRPETMKRGFRFLDVGVGGSGYTVIEAARMGAQAWGVDLSPVGIQTAKRLAGETLPKAALKRCKFKQTPAETLPFPDGYFDAVCSIHVIEHIVDDRGAMSEMLRVTKPGGLCLIDTPHSYLKMPWILLPMVLVVDWKVGHLRHYSRASLDSIMRSLGAETRKTVYHGHLAKLWQNLLGMALPSMKHPESRLWWKLEETDHAASQDDNAAMITMVFQKNKARARSSKKEEPSAEKKRGSFRTPLIAFLLFIVLALGYQVFKKPKYPIRVACVGDSITLAMGGFEKDYPRLLGKKLGRRFEVRNFGAKGATALKNAAGSYQGQVVFRESLAYSPELVIIMLGTNDTKPENWKHKGEFRRDLTELVEYYRSVTGPSKLFLALPSPILGREFLVNGQIMENEVIPIIRQVASETGVGILDVHSAFKDHPKYLYDGMHPDTQGTKAIAAEIYKELEEAHLIFSRDVNSSSPI